MRAAGGRRRGRRLPAEGPGRRGRRASSTRCGGSAEGGSVLDPEVVAADARPPRSEDPLDELTAARARGARADGRGPHEPRDRRAARRDRAGGRAPRDGIFGKLRLPASPEDHRRVLAVLALPSAQTLSRSGPRTASPRRPRERSAVGPGGGGRADRPVAAVDDPERAAAGCVVAARRSGRAAPRRGRAARRRGRARVASGAAPAGGESAGTHPNNGLWPSASIRCPLARPAAGPCTSEPSIGVTTRAPRWVQAGSTSSARSRAAAGRPGGGGGGDSPRRRASTLARERAERRGDTSPATTAHEREPSAAAGWQPDRRSAARPGAAECRRRAEPRREPPRARRSPPAHCAASQAPRRRPELAGALVAILGPLRERPRHHRLERERNGRAHATAASAAGRCRCAARLRHPRRGRRTAACP